MMIDVAIIGGGVIGAMTARELSRYCLNVAVLEKECDVCMAASKANSGIVHAGYDAKTGTNKAKYNVEGNALMPTVCSELGVKFKRNGSFIVAHEGEENDLNNLLERGIANGVKDLKIISGIEARELEPSLSTKIVKVMSAPSGGIVCPYQLTIASMGNAMDNGAKLFTNFCVTSIKKTEYGYIISDGKKEIESKIVINASGVFCDDVFSLLKPSNFKITPRRGEYLLLDKTTKNMVNRTIFRVPTKMGKGILLSPTVDGNYFAGPTSENITDKTDTSTTANGISSIFQGILNSVSSFPKRNVITSFTGIRACSDRDDFIIELSDDGFINVAGIESPGLTAAPAISKKVALMVCEKLNPKINVNFNPNRKSADWFSKLSLIEKNKVIKKTPSFGKIVCRCEEVTEGEILYALAQNPKPSSLDGIKRRTRAGMGRCQGGFCSPSVMELIAKYLNEDISEVTKNGVGSYITVGKTK